MKSFFEGRTSPEKPKFLYHGSTKQNLTEIVPRVSKSKGEDGTEKVFATPDRRIATVYMASDYIGEQPWSSGRYEAALCIFVPMTREEFKQKDLGGAIYKLPSENFSINDGRGMGNDEYAAKTTIPVDSAEYVPSILTEWEKNGIRAYFTTKEQLPDVLKRYGTERYAYLEQLKTESESKKPSF